MEMNQIVRKERKIEKYLNAKIKLMDINNYNKCFYKVPRSLKNLEENVVRLYRGFSYYVEGQYVFITRVKDDVEERYDYQLFTASRKYDNKFLLFKIDKQYDVQEVAVYSGIDLIYSFICEGILYISKTNLNTLSLRVDSTVINKRTKEQMDLTSVINLMLKTTGYRAISTINDKESLRQDRTRRIVTSRDTNVMISKVFDNRKEVLYKKKNYETGSLYVKETNQNRDFLKYYEDDKTIKRWRYFEDGLVWKIVRVYYETETNKLVRNTKEVMLLDGGKFYLSVHGGKGKKKLYYELTSPEGKKETSTVIYE